VLIPLPLTALSLADRDCLPRPCLRHRVAALADVSSSEEGTSVTFPAVDIVACRW
jgi:hypothetical protein